MVTRKDDGPLGLLKTTKADATIWVENLQNGASRFRPMGKDEESYLMTRFGLEGSVVEMPVRVARQSYLQRAVKDGKLRLLTQEEAFARIEELDFEGEGRNSVDRIREAMAKGAGERTSRYVKELSDDGHELRPITEAETWKGRGSKESKKVRRHGSESPVQDPDIRVYSPEEVLTAPVKEGDWEPDRG